TDRIVVNGDIASGPQPVETLDRLASLGDRVVWVRGNADRELVAVARGEHSPYAISNCAGRQLRADQVNRLDRLPHPVRLEVAGFGSVLVCHVSPRAVDDVVLVDSPLQRWAAVVAGLATAVRSVVCGHTHMPYPRYADRRLVVNPGSVGMP